MNVIKWKKFAGKDIKKDRVVVSPVVISKFWVIGWVRFKAYIKIP